MAISVFHYWHSPNFERYLARRALECYPEELSAYLETPLAHLLAYIRTLK